jgi:hypothetical protein
LIPRDWDLGSVAFTVVNANEEAVKMKINNSDEILKNTYPELRPKNKRVAGESFATILNKTLEKNSPSQSVLQNVQSPEKATAMQIRGVTALNEGNQTVIDRLENFIGILDEYRQMLGDPRANLKEIYPLIKTLDAENERLRPVLDSLSDGDELKEILNRAMITASTAIMKFSRGDYNAL